MPSGLKLRNTEGREQWIEGTPTTKGNGGNVTITVTDTNGETTSLQLSYEPFYDKIDWSITPSTTPAITLQWGTDKYTEVNLTPVKFEVRSGSSAPSFSVSSMSPYKMNGDGNGIEGSSGQDSYQQRTVSVVLTDL